jgi:Na+-transporting NADH:ubiquinone oxidoreductase subunit B
VLRRLLDRLEPLFEGDGRLRPLYPLYEAADSILYSSRRANPGAPHVRDAMDLKRMMIVVVVALLPTVYMALWNTGYQANLAMESMGLDHAPGWRGEFIGALGIGYDPRDLWANLIHGGLYFLPVYAVTMAVGGFWEFLFASVRRHEINEGFLVTGLLLPLTLPPAIPLWQVALATTFGVVVGKELFGGTGRNIFNPALTARAFIYFSYPIEMSGDAVWVAVDGFSHATPLTAIMSAGPGVAMEAVGTTFSDAFWGIIPGSMGETSVPACLVGAAILILTGIGSWRTMLSCALGGVACALLFQGIGSETNAMFAMGPAWHLVTGGFAFGLVFMATDPVSSAQTDPGRWTYGFLVGALTVMIRVANPGYPEGIMLAILLGNVFAPLIDWFVEQANVRRRQARYA